jgi:archaellum component FlaC
MSDKGTVVSGPYRDPADVVAPSIDEIDSRMREAEQRIEDVTRRLRGLENRLGPFGMANMDVAAVRGDLLSRIERLEEFVGKVRT